MARPGIPDVESIQGNSALEKMCAPPTESKMTWWRKFFGKDSSGNAGNSTSLAEADLRRPFVARRLSRRVVPGLPRPGTFKRQQSELRDRLEPTKPNPDERRAVSVDRRTRSNSAIANAPRISAPDVLMGTGYGADDIKEIRETHLDELPESPGFLEPPEPGSIALSIQDDDAQSRTASSVDDAVRLELEQRWILNLSMHFRDKSNREKFFVTYAETPNFWRRVTISMDYREAKPGSLEWDLQHTRFQRDKSARIYESIRESLQDIQFYETVTNLKLQTEKEGEPESERLHVHVTEDLHEIISYPPIHAIQHLECRQVREEELNFRSHLSGFVYKVAVGTEIFIKKEIPGPDTVEEFLYEINALKQLSGSSCVIQFGGVIVDNEEKLVKGLLISYAEQGALVDILYDQKGELPWYRRQRWAKQIVQGLSEIHEAGFVQGDFTLSNIVIDADDNAKIIDINRRGCPVGWEPPEVAALISSNQRISMYIGVKSDIYQLGMVLWAIAMEQDEPETHPKPLTMYSAPADVPAYFRDIVATCLSHNPRHRLQASAVLDMFPYIVDTNGRSNTESVISLPVEEAYIDPAYAVDRNDIYKFRGTEYFTNELGRNDHSSNAATHTYVEAADQPYFYHRRGRSPSPRPVNGHSLSPSPQTLYPPSPSMNATHSKEKFSSSHSEGGTNGTNDFNKHIRIVSPPSPPPTAEKWMDPSPAYSETENPPPTHFIDICPDIDGPPHTSQTQNQEPEPEEKKYVDPRPTAADSISITNSTSSFLNCTDLAGVGAHHTTSLIGQTAHSDSDILLDFEKLDLREQSSDMSMGTTALHFDDEDLNMTNTTPTKTIPTIKTTTTPMMEEGKGEMAMAMALDEI